MCRVICRQLAGHGSLHTFLRHGDDVRTRCDVIGRVLADVACALDFIHSRHLVHGNVTSHAVYVVMVIGLVPLQSSNFTLFYKRFLKKNFQYENALQLFP